MCVYFKAYEAIVLHLELWACVFTFQNQESNQCLLFASQNCPKDGVQTHTSESESYTTLSIKVSKEKLVEAK